MGLLHAQPSSSRRASLHSATTFTDFHPLWHNPPVGPAGAEHLTLHFVFKAPIRTRLLLCNWSLGSYVWATALDSLAAGVLVTWEIDRFPQTHLLGTPLLAWSPLSRGCPSITAARAGGVSCFHGMQLPIKSHTKVKVGQRGAAFCWGPYPGAPELCEGAATGLQEARHASFSTYPGLSLLLLLEWTVKTVSFSWSQ